MGSLFKTKNDNGDGTGCTYSWHPESNTVHHTDWKAKDDSIGYPGERHSFDYNPFTGDVTKDHSVNNASPDDKVEWDDWNLFEEDPTGEETTEE